MGNSEGGFEFGSSCKQKSKSCCKMKTYLFPVIAPMFAFGGVCTVRKLVRRHVSRLVLFAYLAAVAAVGPANAQSPFTLRHSVFDPSTNAQTGALQGYSVAVDGNISVTGSPEDATGGTLCGAARVYNATSGALLLRLVNPRASDYDYFGRSVAISGTRVVVGAIEQNPGRQGPGTVYVYDLSSSNPTVPVVTLNNPSLTVGGFGWSVAISGTRLVAGATGVESAYVYDLTAATPTAPVV